MKLSRFSSLLDEVGLSRKEFIVLCVLFSAFIAGLVVKYIKDSHLGSGEITVLRQHPEELSPRLDINTAPWHELLPLPRIGEKRARAIVRHREQNGPFKSVDELLNVDGITPGVLEAIRDFIRIDNEAARIYDKDAEAERWLTSN